MVLGTRTRPSQARVTRKGDRCVKDDWGEREAQRRRQFEGALQEEGGGAGTENGL